MGTERKGRRLEKRNGGGPPKRQSSLRVWLSGDCDPLRTKQMVRRKVKTEEWSLRVQISRGSRLDAALLHTLAWGQCLGFRSGPLPEFWQGIGTFDLRVLAGAGWMTGWDFQLILGWG